MPTIFQVFINRTDLVDCIIPRMIGSQQNSFFMNFGIIWLHPGGPFFTGDKNIVLYIRENYPKVPLRLTEKANKPPKLISLTSDKTSPQEAGSAVTWTADAKDPDKDQILYRFFLNDDPVTKWITGNTWAWNTNDTDVGENQIEVQVRDGKHAGPAGFDDRKSSSFNITAPETKPITTTTVTRPSQTAPAPATAPAPTIESHAESWQKTFGGSNDDGASSVQQTSDGGYIIAGGTLYNMSSRNAWLIKTDSSGNKVWDRTFGGAGGYDAISVQQTSDGGYIIAGQTDSFGAGRGDAWLIKTDANGN